ncbi:MAG: nuclear transport factor 2 family protein [Salinigranum sp.]
MNRDARDELAAAYFRALDADAYDDLRAVFAADVAYRYPGADERRGLDDVLAFLAEEKPTSNTDHEVETRLHDGSASVYAGRIAFDDPDGERSTGEFCDLIAYDGAESAIVSIDVYSR